MLTSWRHWHLVLEICDLYNHLRSKKVFRMKSVYKKTFDFIPHMTYFHWFHMLTSWGPWNLDWGFIMKWASDCNVLWFETRVSSKKKKIVSRKFSIFREHFYFATISLCFRISFAREKCENFHFIREILRQNNAKMFAKNLNKNYAKKHKNVAKNT